MKTRQIIKKAREFTEPFRIDKGKDFRLKDVDRGDTLGFGLEAKLRAKEALAIWTVVVLGFAALFIAGYFLWAKCNGR